MKNNTTIKLAKAIAKTLDLKVEFRNLPEGCFGVAYLPESKIIIDPRISDSEVMSTLCHEIVHHLCYRAGVWKEYHNSTDYKRIMFWYVRAELWVDDVAETLYRYLKLSKDFGKYVRMIRNKKKLREFGLNHYLKYQG